MIDLVKYYGLNEDKIVIQPFGNGLINHTWFVSTTNEKFILQSINTKVFKNPFAIDENINTVKKYLSEKSPDYFLPVAIEAKNGHTMIEENGIYYRLIPFVNCSQTFDVLSNPKLAFEAARQFGKFTKLLSNFDSTNLNITIPDFHNLNLRYKQFEDALQNAYPKRISEAAALIAKIYLHKNIVDEYNIIIQNSNFKKRVTHHDTKISNVLFDKDEKGICVIDLDTLMPGYFISDIGDMLRTYLCAASEEEKDLSKIFLREEYFTAVVNGYLSEMVDELSPDEKNAFIYAGKFMIYMQALRFIADFLLDDIYYGAKYPGHNLNRAMNQMTLLESLIKKELVLKEQIKII